MLIMSFFSITITYISTMTIRITITIAMGSHSPKYNLIGAHQLRIGALTAPTFPKILNPVFVCGYVKVSRLDSR